MTGSELKTKLCATDKFLSRYVYSDITTTGDGHGNLELCDCLLEFLRAYIVIQIKEKDINGASSFKNWFNEKVIKKGRKQIKDSIRQIDEDNYSFYCDGKELIINKTKEFKYIIIFDAKNYDANYIKYFDTREGIEINIFSIEDFEKMLDNLILPSDIFDFLEFRKRFYEKTGKKNPLIIDELSSEVTLFGKLSSDIQVSDYFILKRYLMKGLKIEEVYKFNYLMKQINDLINIDNLLTLEIMMSFNRSEVLQFIQLWDDACYNSRGKDFIMPNVIHDDENVFTCFSKPINSSIDLFNINYDIILRECFEQFNPKRVHIFVMELFSEDQFCISFSLIDNPHCIKEEKMK